MNLFKFKNVIEVPDVLILNYRFIGIWKFPSFVIDDCWFKTTQIFWHVLGHFLNLDFQCWPSVQKIEFKFRLYLFIFFTSSHYIYYFLAHLIISLLIFLFFSFNLFFKQTVWYVAWFYFFLFYCIFFLFY
jgi:hypothetical protein